MIRQPPGTALKMPLKPKDEAKETPHPSFDWRTEQGAQKRDLARFAVEVARALTLRGGGPAARQMGDRVRERWDQLIRRLEGRWARVSEISDRQSEQVERMSAERTVLEALLAFDESLTPQSDIDAILAATLIAVVHSVPRDGALVFLSDVRGQSRRLATERRKGRFWPPAGDQDLCEQVLHGAADGRRIMIEGRPVKSTARDAHRVAHLLAVGVSYGTDNYGAITVGRTSTEDTFTEENAEVLERIGRRLGMALASRLGTGARPATGGVVKPAGFEHIWGEAPALRRAIDLADRLAKADTPVVIEGEMGTGRETLARAIHKRSARKDGPFVVFRGSDLPEETVARGLFGVGDQPGDLELAQGGTLFIDDLGAIDLALQVRLIRLLREAVYERVGDRTPRSADVRLVIASTENVDEDLARGRLRSDLYYNITAGRITLPPLRERGQDIVELARRFAIHSGQKSGKHIEGIELEAARLLESAPMPGNVPQLAQVIERAVLLATGNLVMAVDLPREIAARAMAAGIDTSVWTQQAAAAIRQAGEAGQSGDYRLFRRARKLAQGALDAAFANAVLRAVGRHPSKAASHCGVHRAQWWRLWRSVRESGGVTTREISEAPKTRQETQQK